MTVALRGIPASSSHIKSVDVSAAAKKHGFGLDSTGETSSEREGFSRSHGWVDGWTRPPVWVMLS